MKGLDNFQPVAFADGKALPVFHYKDFPICLYDKVHIYQDAPVTEQKVGFVFQHGAEGGKGRTVTEFFPLGQGD